MLSHPPTQGLLNTRTPATSLAICAMHEPSGTVSFRGAGGSAASSRPRAAQRNSSGALRTKRPSTAAAVVVAIFLVVLVTMVAAYFRASKPTTMTSPASTLGDGGGSVNTLHHHQYPSTASVLPSRVTVDHSSTRVVSPSASRAPLPLPPSATTNSPVVSAAIAEAKVGADLYVSARLLIPVAVDGGDGSPSSGTSLHGLEWNLIAFREVVDGLVQRMTNVTSSALITHPPSLTAMPRLANNRRLPNGKIIRAGDEAHEKLLRRADVGESDEEVSLKRYRAGGIGLLMPLATVFPTVASRREVPPIWRRVADRSQSCAALQPDAIEPPLTGGQYDPMFITYTKRRKQEREHHCFANSAMFLLMRPQPYGSVVQQLEGIMALLYVASLSGRTAVVPPIRMPSGRLVRLSSVADIRHLMAATAAMDAQPLCVIEEDEFEVMEAARRSWRQQDMSYDAHSTPAPLSHAKADIHPPQATLTVDDVECAMDGWLHKKSVINSLSGGLQFRCGEEPAMPPMPSYGKSTFAAWELETAIDAVLRAASTSFHKYVMVDHLALDAVGAIVSRLHDDEAVWRRGNESTSEAPPRDLWKCIWGLVQPHPFVRRAVLLAEGVVEETFPSGGARDLTLEDRGGKAVGLSNVTDFGFQGEQSFDFRSARRDDVFLFVDPDVGRGVVCSDALLRRADVSDHRWNCTLSAEALQHVAEDAVLRSRSGIIILHGPDDAGEARRLSLLLRRAILSLQSSTTSATSPPRVMTQDFLFGRHNRLTKYLRVVTDRRKLFLGGNNGLLVRGHSSATGVERPFLLSNEFAAEPQLLEELTQLWMCVGGRVWISAAPWSATSHFVHERRRAQEKRVTRLGL